MSFQCAGSDIAFREVNAVRDSQFSTLSRNEGDIVAP